MQYDGKEEEAIIPWLRHTDDFPNKPPLPVTVTPENRRCYPVVSPVDCHQAKARQGRWRLRSASRTLQTILASSTTWKSYMPMQTKSAPFSKA